LKEQPSKAWIGRWVSVTGLVDVPYESKRYGHKHLSITVQEEGQIQQLDEAEAGFRLASISQTPLPRGLPGAASSGAPAPARPSTADGTRKPRRAGRRRRAAAATSAQQAARSSWPQLARIRRWMLAIGTIIVLVISVMFMMSLGT